MPALVPTDVVGRIVWLGFQPDPVQDLTIRTVPLDEMALAMPAKATRG